MPRRSTRRGRWGSPTRTGNATSVFEAIEADLLAGDYAPGCAGGATTLERAATSASFQQAVSEAFGTWTATLTAKLSGRGFSADRATALADTIVAAMEGATMLARARRSPAPLRHVADILEAAINDTPHG